MIRPINRCLNVQLLNLCQRAIALEELNDKIKANLPSPLRDNCQAAAFNRGSLVISTLNAAWATELRYQVPELRDRLRKAGLYQLTSIKITIADIAPQLIPNKASPESHPLSEGARDCLKTASEHCSYPPLKEALFHLANAGKS
ncbi:Zn-ribbon-containing, possibly RNA-binding protein and truncated derivatives [Legionella massiliensis]|uniref:Zn-ribbon-containing, possibly RNA-binding protein and truncated derivatives n=1 Tax=Legionella massiliensis TaxID=1034943 RepID=A0A078KRW5_9GAMM|nr:DUF721 domain-containing protein [Legionella massiliensis]CDZ75841.1 Zn-ribbon-containing, possibly RNA-binding protein and truncated derivatives [Legionella massiliensis]CEE11579.1 hypothetical protein BN1094_00100 [Legionella massiliensis]